MFRIFSALVCLLTLVTPVAAEYIHPGDVDVKTVRYNPDARKIFPGTYHYSVEWEGIPVAKAEVEIKEPLGDSAQELVEVSTNTKTSGLVSAFYRMKHHSESVFKKDDYQPVKFTSYQRENSKKKYRNVHFEDDGRVVSERWKKGKEKTKIQFESDNAVFDPISAAFLARSLDLEEGKEISFDVYNGKHRFLIGFSVKGKERVKVGREWHQAFKVIPSVTKLTDSEGEQKLRSAALWISADEEREILKLESKVWIGSVTAEFEKFESAEPTVAEPAIAENDTESEPGAKPKQTAKASQSIELAHKN